MFEFTTVQTSKKRLVPVWWMLHRTVWLHTHNLPLESEENGFINRESASHLHLCSPGLFSTLTSKRNQQTQVELTVIVMNNLKILNRSLSDSAVEVEHVGLCVIVPHRRLVVKFNHALRVLVLPPGQQWFMVLH